MKKIIALFAMLAFVAGVATAAPKAEKKIVTVVFTTDIDCAHCSQKVYNSIPYEKGIKDVVVNVQKKTVLVKFDAAKNKGARGEDKILSADGSKVKVAVIATDEELMIAKDTAELVAK